MAYIEWVDDEGTGTLTPNVPAGPGRRFREWVPTVQPVGPARYALGTGQRFQFEHRRDYLASFVVPYLRGAAQHLLVHRFLVHAFKGCDFYVNTQDNANRVYLCRLAEGADPAFTQEDATLLEYALALTVKHTASAPLICDYTEA